jgi:hypothetical protein
VSDLERELLELKERVSESITPSPGMAGRVFHRARIRRVVTGMTGVLVAGALGLASIAGVRTFVAPTSEGPVGPQPNIESPTPSDLNPRVTAAIPVGAEPRTVVVGEGAVWVAVLDRDDGMENYSVVRIDPESNEVAARIPLEIGVDRLAVGFGAVWAGGYSEQDGAAIARIDPQNNEVVATIGGVTDPEVGIDMSGGASVWAIAPGESPPDSHTLARIDPETNEIVSTIPVGPITDIAVGEGAVWVLKAHIEGDVVGAKDVVKVDPATNRVVGTATLDAHYIRLLAGAGAVWAPGWLHDFADVGTGQGDRPVVVRIDPESAEISQEPISLHTTFRPFGVGEGGVWIISGPEKPSGLCRLNQLTHQVDECVEPGDLAEVFFDPAVLDSASHTLWVANERETVTRVDLR